MPLRAYLSTLLCILLGLQMPGSHLWAQAQDGPPPAKLNLIIVEGEGAINNIKQRTAREPIVRVEDENHKPLAGASVVFLLPSNGASGAFTNGSRLLTVLTDQNGQAVMRGFTPNNTAGQMQVRVTASFRGQTATATITQTNVLAAAGAAGAAGAAAGAGKLIAILAVVGGAAAAGIAVAATRGNGSGNPGSGVTGPPPVTPTVINPGTPTVGPPR